MNRIEPTGVPPCDYAMWPGMGVFEAAGLVRVRAKKEKKPQVFRARKLRVLVYMLTGNGALTARIFGVSSQTVYGDWYRFMRSMEWKFGYRAIPREDEDIEAELPILREHLLRQIAAEEFP